ncbi:MAG: endo-1,4-beta-xylanase [Caulobacter sp.]|nr:endo-1,4-beta-xylanase [Caulobacter sp.]
MTAGATRRSLLAGVAGLAGLPAQVMARDSTAAGLAALAARRGVDYGAAVEPENLARDSSFADLINRECVSVTPENHLKWNILRPTPDHFDFGGADAVVAFAKARQLAVHGHCLVWHEANPAWLAAGLTRQNAEALLNHHIGKVVGRYAGHVGSWDVVNEPVERNDRRPDGLRRSLWLSSLGPDYIPLAFEAAHRADPAARLVLSDYGLEYDDEPWMVEKRGSLLALLADWKRAGVPIHALGIQGHLIGSRPPAFGTGLQNFLRDVGRLGLDIHVTELDVNDQQVAGGQDHRDRIVADCYRAFLRAVLTSSRLRVVTTWGLSDRYSSKQDMFPRPDGAPVRPLPFDRELSRKAAWHAMADAFSVR